MNDKLVEIGQFRDYIEAELARQRLEDAGIKAVIAGQNAANIYAGVPAIEGPSLQVLESQAEKARQILAKKAPDPFFDEEQ